MVTVRSLASARTILLAILVVLGAAGCSSPDERAAGYLATAREHYEAGDLDRARVDLRNVLSIQPRNGEAAYLMALVDERAGDYRAVLRNLQLAVDAKPDLLDARIKLGNYLVVGNQVAGARAQADAALAIAPDRASVRLLNARVLYIAGDPDKALAEAGEALRLEPGRADAVTFVANIHAAAGRMDQALATTDEAIRTSPPAAAEGLRRVRVTLLLAAGQAAEAEQELGRMAADYPANTTYDLALARLYASQGRPADAEARVRALVARQPDNADWPIQLAGLLAQEKKAAEAETVLKAAVTRIPASGAIKFALAGFYESSGRPDDARRLYEAIAAAGPLAADGLAARNRLVALAVTTDPARARTLLEEILRDAPNNADALLVRAAFSYQDGKLDAAVADLRTALAREPGSARVLLMLARTYARRGEWPLAEDAYRRLLEVAPGSTGAATELAAVVSRSGNLVGAEEILRQATERDPSSPGASQGLVTTLLGQGNFAGAEGEARRLLAQGDASGSADYQLGVALQLQNDADQAIAAYRAALAKTPTADAPLAALVQLLVKNGRATEATSYLEQHVKAHPDHAAGRLLLAIRYRDSGRVDAARALLADLVAAEPGLAAAWVAYAATYPADGPDQLRLLAEGHRRVPADVQLGLALGAAYQARGRYEDAIRAYEEVLKAGGSSEFLASNLAQLLLDVRNDPASQARALELTRQFDGSRHPFQLGVLGWARFRNGQFPEAVQALEQAVAASPQPSPQLRYYLGMAYARAGNEDGARRELRQAVDGATSSGATFTGLDSARSALRELGEGPG